MDYLVRGENTRLFPTTLIPTPASVVVVAMRYGERALTIPTEIENALNADPRLGKIARYALGKTDYHDTIRPKLIAIDQCVRSLTGRTERAKGWVDTGPVLERDFSEQAGIGFTGKNTCSINSHFGSWFFIASLWLPETLEYDSLTTINEGTLTWPGWHAPYPPKSRVGGCGSCTRCQSACPTGALVDDYTLDARKCIAYWTIEAKTAPPPPLAKNFGRWIFGCDECQTACPWNMAIKPSHPAKPSLPITPINPQEVAEYLWPNGPWIVLDEGFQPDTPYWIDDHAFREKFCGSPILRPKRAGMRRNVEIAMGYRRDT